MQDLLLEMPTGTLKVCKEMRWQQQQQMQQNERTVCRNCSSQALAGIRWCCAASTGSVINSAVVLAVKLAKLSPSG